MITIWVKVESMLDSIESNSMAVTACEWALPRLEALLLELENAIHNDSKDIHRNDAVHPHQQRLNIDLNRQAMEQVRTLIQHILLLVDATEKTTIHQLQQQLHQDTQHIRKIMEQHCAHTVEQVKPWLMEEEIRDFYMLRHTENGRLVVAGSRDYSYYHNVELIFHEVQFVMLPALVFEADRLRLATAEELAQLDGIMHGHQHMGRVFCLESTFEGTRYYVVARQLQYNTDTVYYYKREPLGPGERIAEYLPLKDD